VTEGWGGRGSGDAPGISSGQVGGCCSDDLITALRLPIYPLMADEENEDHKG
jgi:hypothetical protein